MAKKRAVKTLSDQMREAVINAPITRYAIWRKTGIHESALSRFVNGESGLSLENVDKLAELLGWELMIAESVGSKRGKEKER